MLRTFHAVALSLVLLILAACTNTAAVRSESGLKLNLSAKDKEGYVVLKVVTLRPISLLNPNWKSIKISSSSNQSEMEDIMPPYGMLMGKHIPTESLYFAKLNAGEYDITGFGSSGPDGVGWVIKALYSDLASVKQKLHFTVQAGHLANLGTIVYAPKIENENPEKIFLLNGSMGKKSAYNTLIYELQQSGISLEEGGGWDTNTTPEAEAEVLSAARPFVSLLTFSKSSNGLEAGSNLGLIFRRVGPQSWSSESINTLGRIYSIGKTLDGKVVVGSDYGEYFVQAKSRTWSSFRVGQEKGRIIHIEPRADGSAIFITGDLLKTRVWFKKSLEDDFGLSTEIVKTDGPPDNLLVTDDELILAGNIPGFTRETVISRINKKTLSVTSKKENFWVIDWQYMQDRTVNLTRMNGLSLYSSTWENNGTTWKHSDNPVVLSYWPDRQHGVSIKFSAGFTMVSNQLQITSDGGKTWAQTGKPLDTRDFAGRIVFADDNEIMVQGSNMLYSTRDKGQTWQRIFPPESTISR